MSTVKELLADLGLPHTQGDLDESVRVALAGLKARRDREQARQAAHGQMLATFKEELAKVDAEEKAPPIVVERSGRLACRCGDDACPFHEGGS